MNDLVCKLFVNPEKNLLGKVGFMLKRRQGGSLSVPESFSDSAEL